MTIFVIGIKIICVEVVQTFRLLRIRLRDAVSGKLCMSPLYIFQLFLYRNVGRNSNPYRRQLLQPGESPPCMYNFTLRKCDFINIML